MADRRPPGNSAKIIAALDAYLNNPRWRIVAEHGDFVLLRQERTAQ